MAGEIVTMTTTTKVIMLTASIVTMTTGMTNEKPYAGGDSLKAVEKFFIEKNQYVERK